MSSFPIDAFAGGETPEEMRAVLPTLVGHRIEQTDLEICGVCGYAHAVTLILDDGREICFGPSQNECENPSCEGYAVTVWHHDEDRYPRE